MFKLVQKTQATWHAVRLWISHTPLDELLSLILLCMMVIGYFESLRWPLPGPKATHGILKGLALLLLAGFLFFRRKLHSIIDPKMIVISLVWFMSYAVSAVLSQDVGTSLLHMWYPFISLLFIYSFSIIRIKKSFFYLFLSASILLIFITFIFSLFSIIFRYSVDNIYYFIFLDHRANFLLDEIRKFGKYASLGPYIMLVPATFYFMVDRSSSIYKKLLSFAMLLMSLITAVISNNRIDALVFAIQWLVYMFFISRKQAVLSLVPTILAVSFGLFVTQLYFGFNLEQRILRPALERDQETVSMRFTYWETAMRNFKNFPLFGTGPNTYNSVSDFPLRRYWIDGVRDYTIKQDYGIGVHNLFFERLSDTGLFGFLAFVVLLTYCLQIDIKALLRLRPKGKEQVAKYVFISLASWSWILYGITDNGYGAQGMIVFFFIRGLMYHYDQAIA